MRTLTTTISLLLLVSCGSISKKDKTSSDPAAVLPGDWLVLYAEHKLKGPDQRDIYGRKQDSIIEAKGLKLISFSNDHSFIQMDYPDTRGNWKLTDAKEIEVKGAGNGFDNFKTEFLGFARDTLQIVEYAEMEGEKVKLIWNLKKVDQPRLFTARNNNWRKKPSATESDEQLRSRLSDILDYYSHYYKLVAKESIYFIQTRVPLPFSYYQHAMGMKSFVENSDFTKLFFDNEQASKAYRLLTATMNSLNNEFPRKENFVEEYAEFMGKMAERIKTIPAS
jgi:hypothetical protein